MNMDEETAERSVEFLWKASRLVPTRSALQCHYLLKCRSLQSNEDMYLSAKAFRKSAMCMFCTNVWSSGRCHVSIMPKKIPGKKMKKIIHKQEASPELLKPIEKKLFEKYKTGKDNKLVLKCLVCQKRTILPLSKPIKQKATDVQSEDVETPIQNKKKKKKKKDIYAGLNSSVVSAYTPRRESPFLKGNEKNKKQITPSDLNSSMLPALSSQKEQLHSRIERKTQEKCNNSTSFGTPKRKVQNSTVSVRQQIIEAKEQIKASRKKNKDKIALEMENSAKKAKKCNALRNILADAAATPSRRPTLKEFFASLK